MLYLANIGFYGTIKALMTLYKGGKQKMNNICSQLEKKVYHLKNFAMIIIKTYQKINISINSINDNTSTINNKLEY